MRWPLPGALGEQLDESERLDPAGLTASLHTIPNGRVVLIRLPPAEHTTEVHLAAITLVRDKDPRLFVLEHSWTLDNQPSTVLGEWTERGHINFGSGPKPAEAAFLAAVAERLG